MNMWAGHKLDIQQTDFSLGIKMQREKSLFFFFFFKKKNLGCISREAGVCIAEELVT